MLKAILFDLGDTLLSFARMNGTAEFEDAARRTYDHLQSQGHKLPSFRGYVWRHLWGLQWAWAWSRLRPGREASCEKVMRRVCRQMDLRLEEAALQELAWLWYRPAVYYSSVEEGTIATLQMLRQRGLKLAIVSNTLIPGRVLDRHIALAGFLEYFPIRLYSCEVGYRKPHPRIFRAALEAVGVEPQEALFVGDNVVNDVKGARRVGIPTAFKCSGKKRSCPQADYTIQRISDLQELVQKLSCPQVPAVSSAASATLQTS